ncbi:MAG: RagB/SusD family nutrient uptake outer membrane protein, partial [Duncaniella sp.]|nr:RagB/SusD family nutrient uptake outer membrane protein [Duncaniella sp.]
NSDYATDDAVTSNKNDNFATIATGGWSVTNNPFSVWDRYLNNIQNLNMFLENEPRVTWAEDPEAAELFKMRFIGEAHGLRALYMYYLLRNHSGYTDDGQLMGIIKLDHYLTSGEDYNMPRGTFRECVDMILSDLDEAESRLPLEFENMNPNDPVPAPFDAVTTNPGIYNRVMGEYGRQMVSRTITRAIRSRVTLLAASPAFEASGITWAEAAEAAGSVLETIGGIPGMDPNGITYYCNTNEIDNLAEGQSTKEVFWRANHSDDRSQETDHFPPSLYGNGRMNPTQNLVDAFPMANGYPISDSRSGYNENNPYSGRDKRFAAYIIYNGATEGVSNTVINTGSDATTADGLNKRETSTRTGYYMKKRLRMDVVCNPSGAQNKRHITPRFRYTEFFLNYAEAANEAWGPKVAGGKYSYSAYDVIKAIRSRAGISDTKYLDECAADKAKMRELIRNERRIELCFEGHRFWDLR